MIDLQQLGFLLNPNCCKKTKYNVWNIKKLFLNSDLYGRKKMIFCMKILK